MNDFLLVFLLFVPSFALLWSGVCFFIAVLGGWRTLARSYAENAATFTGRRWSMLRGRLGVAQYKGTLTVGADLRGLYIAVLILFRPGHPSLFIPWDDVDIREVDAFFGRRIEFAFRRHPNVRLSIPKSIGEEIAREGNRPVARA